MGFMESYLKRMGEPLFGRLSNRKIREGVLVGMTYELEKMIPSFLPESAMAGSEVWGKSLQWNPGEKIRIIAPSGKGKTTLIHALYGLQKAYSGRILLGGQDLRRFGDPEWAAARKVKLAIVFQDLRLFPHLTGYENIEVNAALMGELDSAKVGKQAEAINITDSMNRPCSNLSQGEQQRIALIRALVQPFEWLLLDEPFSHLDEDTARAAATLISDVCRERNAGLLITSLGNDAYLSIDREYAI